MKKKVALFDFDNTVMQGDSIRYLLRYHLKRYPWHVYKFIKVAVLYLLSLLKIVSFEKSKSALLFPILYMDNDEIASFYKNNLESHYYQNVVAEMQKRKEEGYVVVLCTASIEAYMKYNQLPIDQLIGTRTQIQNKKIKVIGKNCKNEEKIVRIQEYFESENIVIDYDNSYGYSDSNHDIPMLSLVHNRKRILLKTGEIIGFVE